MTSYIVMQNYFGFKPAGLAPANTNVVSEFAGQQLLCVNPGVGVTLFDSEYEAQQAIDRTRAARAELYSPSDGYAQERNWRVEKMKVGELHT